MRTPASFNNRAYTLYKNMSLNDKPMISATRFIALCQVLFFLSGCGLKGPLYLPPPEPVAVQQPKPDSVSKPKAVSSKSQQQKTPEVAPDAPAQTSPAPADSSPYGQNQSPVK